MNKFKLKSWQIILIKKKVNTYLRSELKDTQNTIFSWCLKNKFNFVRGWIFTFLKINHPANFFAMDDNSYYDGSRMFTRVAKLSGLSVDLVWYFFFLGILVHSFDNCIEFFLFFIILSHLRHVFFLFHSSFHVFFFLMKILILFKIR